MIMMNYFFSDWRSKIYWFIDAKNWLAALLILIFAWIVALIIAAPAGEVTLGTLNPNTQANWAKNFIQFTNDQSPPIRDLIQLGCVVHLIFWLSIMYLVIPAIYLGLVVNYLRQKLVRRRLAVLDATRSPPE